jgi:DNA-binding XRE family transcriptional regulator
MKTMNHNQVKELLFNEDPDLKAEYDALAPIYELQKEVIQMRLDAHLSQKELAELVGTKQSAISRLEGGNYNPSIEFLSKIARALGKECHVTFR